MLYLTDLRPSAKFGSLEEQIFELAHAFQEQGGLFLPVFGAPLEGQAATRYEAAQLPAESLDLYQFNFPTLRRLLQLIRQHSIELVDWNFYGAINPYVLSLSVLAPRLQHYLTDHNSRLPGAGPAVGGWRQSMKKVLLKRYGKVLCISDFVLESLAQQNTWSNLSRCRFFINTNRFQPDAPTRLRVRRELNAEGRFVVLTVAHLIDWKGVDILIRALAELPEAAVLWVVGDGEERARLETLCREVGVAERVRFLGNQHYVEPYMQAADCFVCPSRWAEAMGFVNLEALACQLPVIASDTGGIPEFVEDGETGFLFPVGDHRQLADKLKLLISDPETHRRMGLQARQSAIEKFSIESRLPEYLDLYRAVAPK